MESLRHDEYHPSVYNNSYMCKFKSLIVGIGLGYTILVCDSSKLKFVLI